MYPLVKRVEASPQSKAKSDYLCIACGKAMEKPMEHVHKPLYDLLNDAEVQQAMEAAEEAAD